MSEQHDPQRPPILGSGLLESIAEGALDDDYYRADRRKPGTGMRTRLVLGCALAVLAGLLTIGAVQTARDKPSDVAERDKLINDVKSHKDQLSERSARAEDLEDQIERLRTSLGRPDPLSSEVELAAGSEAAQGEGLVITLEDGQNELVHDHDLQRAVNGLWYAGAEAVAINDQRIGTLSAIHEAGGVITVNFRNVAAPYKVTAIGPASGLQERFLSNVAGRYLLGRQHEAGIDFSLHMSEELTVPRVPAARLHLNHAEAMDDPS